MIRNRTIHTPSDFLKEDSHNYTPSIFNYDWVSLRNLPPFSLSDVPVMLCDPRVLYGIYLLKGPIHSKAKLYVNCQNKDVKTFLVNQITRFWAYGLKVALRCVEWGYSCAEPVYRIVSNQIAFDLLKGFSASDSHPIVGKKTNMVKAAKIKPFANQADVEDFNLDMPKVFWGVHGEEIHPYFGRSRLYGAYRPWNESTCEGGFRDSRRLFYYKYAYSGGGWRYPVGTTAQYSATGDVLPQIPNEWIARDMGDKARAGASFYVPNERDEKGEPLWERIPPDAPNAPVGLQEYGLDLRDEILEGMGIPPEVGKAQGTGAYAGRLIPMVAYYSVLGDILQQIIISADRYIWRGLVDYNFGKKAEYEIVPFDMSSDMEEDVQEKKRPSKMKDGYGDGDKKGSKKDSTLSSAEDAEVHPIERGSSLVQVEYRDTIDDDSILIHPVTGKFFKRVAA